MKKLPIVGIFVYLWCVSLADDQWRGNILCLMGVPSASHHIWNRSLMLELTRRGFNLTVLTVEIEESQPNLHFITMEDIYEVVQSEWNTDSQLDTTRKNPWSLIIDTYNFYHFVSQKLVKTKGFRRLMDYPDDFVFSAVIHDFTLGQVMLGFVEKFGSPPLISVSPFGVPPHTWAAAGEPHLAPFSPHFATGYSAEMHFGQKIINLLTHFWDWIYREFVFLHRETSLAREFFPSVDLPAIERSTSAILVNREPLVDGGGTVPTHVINIGGLHASRDGWLSPEVEHTLKSSPKSVILMALGSNMRSDLLGEEILSKFIRVFRKLRQFTIIWKYEGERPSNWPENILTVDWIDQNKILEHPNLVLFITHGGLLSVQEAVWNGIPTLGIPLFMDQHSNIARAVSRGFAQEIDVNSFTAEELEGKILRLIESKEYGSSVRRISRMWRMQESPLLRAASWIEMVSENGKVDHLKCQVSVYDILIPLIIALFCANLLLDGVMATISWMAKKRQEKKVKTQ